MPRREAGLAPRSRANSLGKAQYIVYICTIFVYNFYIFNISCRFINVFFWLFIWNYKNIWKFIAYQKIIDQLVDELAPPIDMDGCSARLLDAVESALKEADI